MLLPVTKPDMYVSIHYHNKYNTVEYLLIVVRVVSRLYERGLFALMKIIDYSLYCVKLPLDLVISYGISPGNFPF
jgi:hypothetical protein